LIGGSINSKEKVQKLADSKIFWNMYFFRRNFTSSGSVTVRNVQKHGINANKNEL
jgi:hypothetical protein